MKQLIIGLVTILVVTACSRTVSTGGEVQATDLPSTSAQSASSAYLLGLRDALAGYKAAVEVIDQQVGMYEVNDQWLDDAGWKETTFQALDDLLLVADQLKQLPAAPAELGEADRLAKQLADEIPLYVTNMKDGINKKDVNAIDRARINGDNATRYFENLATEVSRFLGTPVP